MSTYTRMKEKTDTKPVQDRGCRRHVTDQFAMFVQLMIAVLAALGLHAIGKFAMTGALAYRNRKQGCSQATWRSRFAASALSAKGFVTLLIHPSSTGTLLVR